MSWLIVAIVQVRGNDGLSRAVAMGIGNTKLI